MGKIDRGKDKALTPREAAFCEAYADKSRETYRDATRAALAAGYAKGSERNAGWRVKRRPHVQARLRAMLPTEMKSPPTVDVDAVGTGKRRMVEAEMLKIVEDDKAPRSDRIRAADIYAKIAGIYSTRTVFEEPDRQHELDDAAQEEAQALAGLRLMQSPGSLSTGVQFPEPGVVFGGSESSGKEVGGDGG